MLFRSDATYLGQDFLAPRGGRLPLIPESWSRKLMDGGRAFDKHSFMAFRAAENVNREIGFFGGYARGLQRGLSQKEAMAEGMRTLEKTTAMYGIWNAPSVFRHPVGRAFFHLNRFTISAMHRALEMVRRFPQHPGRALRAAGGMLLITQLAQVMGQDMNFIFGQPLSEMGDPLPDQFTAGFNFPEMLEESPALWEMTVEPRKTQIGRAHV